jgi:hypothetical protein
MDISRPPLRVHNKNGGNSHLPGRGDQGCLRLAALEEDKNRRAT